MILILILALARPVDEGKQLLRETVSLLVGLIKSFSPDRLGEDEVPYRTANDI